MTMITRVQIPMYPIGEFEGGSSADDNYDIANGVFKALKAAGTQITILPRGRAHVFDMYTEPETVRGILSSHFNIPDGVSLRERHTITEQKIEKPGEDNIGHLFVILPPT